MTAALYLRVSTDEQTVENQRADLERLAAARGFTDVTVYEETESAAKDRAVLSQMMTSIRAGKHSTIIVWAIDRLHRSMVGAVNTVLELDRLGVRIVSVREPWLDTVGPVRELLVAIFGWVAQQERERLRERTVAGMQRAQRAGKRVGRPSREITAAHIARARELRAEGNPWRRIAMALKVPVRTLRRHLEQAKQPIQAV
ncbi:MAG: hypothetical protein A2341_07565 [Deltaproteobacteria bacterium RIFOXYB12_FULL_58_9]|nr:MAG: hypothetical protein A2341_07565 [Deltaproteobacteria bacterium RIFOXYB12_FULL_58_9]